MGPGFDSRSAHSSPHVALVVTPGQSAMQFVGVSGPSHFLSPQHLLWRCFVHSLTARGRSTLIRRACLLSTGSLEPAEVAVGGLVTLLRVSAAAGFGFVGAISRSRSSAQPTNEAEIADLEGIVGEGGGRKEGARRAQA